MYTLNDGADVSREQIEQAFTAGAAVLVHSNRNGGTYTGLALDGKHRDTRGECYSVWEEVWTTTPASLAAALRAAR